MQNEAPVGKATSRVAAMHKAQAKREREAARAAARAAAPKLKKPAPKVRRLEAQPASGSFLIFGSHSHVADVYLWLRYPISISLVPHPWIDPRSAYPLITFASPPHLTPPFDHDDTKRQCY
jgi:hypothetical protein